MKSDKNVNNKSMKPEKNVNRKTNNEMNKKAGADKSVKSATPLSSPKKTSRCPVSKKCGGCTMIDLPMDKQIARKQALVEECIGEFGKVDPVIRMKNPDRYRNKVTSIFGLDRKGHPVCGVYRERSHEIIPVKSCLIEDKQADAIIQTIYGMLQSFKIRVYNEDTGMGLLRAVQVRTAHETKQVMVTLVTNGPVFPSKNNFVKVLLEKHPEITTIVQNINERVTTMVLGDREKTLYGPGYIVDTLCGKKFRISSRSFYQVNSLQTEKLYRIGIDAAGLSGKERILDSYCGIGTIGICASDYCAEVIGVELNPEAVRDAQINIRENEAGNVRIYEADAGQFMLDMKEKGEKLDVLFMDPPRSGASEEFLESACALAPKKIVYISCNPVTLGENLKVFTANGYRMKKAVPVDMFPYTEGIETVSLLVHI